MNLRILSAILGLATATAIVERAQADTLSIAAVAGAPVGGALAGGEVSEQAALCAAPSELNRPRTALPHVAAAVRAHGTLDILAVGSATMLGQRGQSQGSYPDRMVAMLRAAFPALTIRVTVHGGRGVTATDMLATLREELSQRAYQLVLWQTATVEAVRNIPPDELSRTLSDGAERVRSANADLVLIDPQYSRFLRANANLDPYLQVLQQAGSLADVALFRRYDLMRYWVDAGQIDLERAAKQDRPRVAEELHDCLARALARLIAEAGDTSAH